MQKSSWNKEQHPMLLCLAASKVGTALGYHPVKDKITVVEELLGHRETKRRQPCKTPALRYGIHRLRQSDPEFSGRNINKDHHIHGDFEKERNDAIQACKAAVQRGDDQVFDRGFVNRLAAKAKRDYQARYEGGWTKVHSDMVYRCVHTEIHKTIGRLMEESVLNHYEKKSGKAIVDRQKDVSGEVLPGLLEVKGFIDGTTDGGQTLVEVKTRIGARRRPGGGGLSVCALDRTQVHVYMHRLGIRNAMILEKNLTTKELRILRVPFDDVFWTEAVLRPLADFCAGVASQKCPSGNDEIAD